MSHDFSKEDMTGYVPRNSPHSLPMRAMGVASMSIGFFSCIVFWWFPFGIILSSVGLTLGVIAYLRGVRVGDGDNLAFLGPLVCACSLTMALTLRFGIDFMLNR